jgi:SAM-dependent methyltransferase
VAYDGRGLKFGSVAEQYDRFRPSPPPEAASIFADLHGVELLEVAAGTGLWTRFLLQLGASVTIVEPDDEMRAVLERRSPGVRALPGTAEMLPVADSSFDVVVVSSAWHWFEQPRATREMARVLSDHGKLYVLWNVFSRDVAWLERLTELRENPNDENARPRGWKATFLDDGEFVDAREIELHWVWPRTADQLISVFGTYSGALVKSDEDRLAMQEELRRRVEGIAVGGVVDVPMTLRGTVATRSVR